MVPCGIGGFPPGRSVASRPSILLLQEGLIEAAMAADKTNKTTQTVTKLTKRTVVVCGCSAAERKRSNADILDKLTNPGYITLFFCNGCFFRISYLHTREGGRGQEGQGVGRGEAEMGGEAEEQERELARNEKEKL